jgi:broad specificity phosphatase PhoE
VEGEFMRLLLIRHGEIDSNLQKRFCGITNSPLNTNGIKQAHHLKTLLKKEKVDLIYSSPLLRTRQTSRIVFSNKKIRFASELKEIDFGEIECMQVEEVKKKYPEFHRKWLANINTATPPGGESVRECRKRVWGFIQSLIKNKNNQNKTIALVMHGGPIKILIAEILKLGNNGFWMFHPEPASATTIEYYNGYFCLLGRNFYYGKDYPGFGWRP